MRVDTPSNLDSYRRTTLSCEDCGLKRLCFPRQLSEPLRQRMEHSIQRRKLLRSGEHLFHAGQNLRGLQVLRSGSVRLYRLSAQGDERTSHFVMPGEVLGLGALHGRCHPDSAQALEDARYCEIPLPVIDRLSQGNPQLPQALIELISEHLEETRQLLLAVGSGSATERLAAFIDNLARRRTRRSLDARSFRLSMQRKEIANFLGLTVETVSRTLGQLQRRQLISIRGKQLCINDPDGLRSLCDPGLNNTVGVQA